jgi:hypothetical protein
MCYVLYIFLTYLLTLPQIFVISVCNSYVWERVFIYCVFVVYLRAGTDYKAATRNATVAATTFL